jgi:hypothetical protein
MLLREGAEHVSVTVDLIIYLDDYFDHINHQRLPITVDT